MDQPTRRHCWTASLQSPREKEFEHMSAGFQRVAPTQPSDFIINSDWVSEDMNKSPSFTGRKYRPWSYEFQGARYWPYGTIEKRIEEEVDRRRLIQSAPVSLSLEPRSVIREERSLLSSPMRLEVLQSRSPWRSASYPGCPDRDTDYGRSDSDLNRYTSDIQYSPHSQDYRSGTDLYSTNGPQCADPMTNTSKYAGDNLFGTVRKTASPYSYGVSGQQLASDKLPIIYPQKPTASYMNFVNSQWLR